MQKPFFHAYALKPETLGATLRLRRKQLGYTLTEMEEKTAAALAEEMKKVGIAVK